MAEPTSSQPTPPDVLVTDEELLALPLWAIVAFAARCARRVHPLLLSSWSDRPAHHLEPVESAIAFAESVARKPNQLASHVDLSKEVALGPWGKSAKEQSRLACGTAIIRAAQSAAEVAIAARSHITSGNIREDAEVMDRVVDSALAAAMLAQRAVTAAFSHVDAHVAMVRNDIQSLTTLAKQNRWTDESPVDVDALGPLWPPGKEPAWAEKLSVESNMESKESSLPGEEDLMSLSHWSIVTFAIRCALRVRPLCFNDKNLLLTESDIDEGLTIAEHAAATGTRQPSVSRVVDHVSQFANLTEDKIALAAISAVQAAVFASDCESNVSFHVFRAARQAALAAASYFGSVTSSEFIKFRRAMWRDLDRLIALDAAGTFDKNKGVDIAILGNLWQPGEEPEWAKPQSPPPDIVPEKIELTIRIPAGATQEEIDAIIADFVAGATKAHQAHGGSGLIVDGIEVYQHAPKGAGVLS